MERTFTIETIIRVISEPGDATRYDYLIKKNYDEYVIAPYESTFSFPQRLNYYDIKDIETVDDAQGFILNNSEHERVNPHTMLECIRAIKLIHSK